MVTIFCGAKVLGLVVKQCRPFRRLALKTVFRLNACLNEPEHSVPQPSVPDQPAAARPVRLTDELQRLIQSFRERAVHLRDVLEVMQGRGYTMLLILLAFPFCTPLPMPGFSMPFGLVIAAIGLRLALGQRPWLPDWLLNKKLPPRFFTRLLGATHKLANWLQRLLRPRFQVIFRWWLVRHLIGMMIFISGILMMLPFPVPLSNGVPALTVLLLAAAMLEEDGYVAIAGGIMFLLALAFFAVLVWGGVEVIEALRNEFADWLWPDQSEAAP